MSQEFDDSDPLRSAEEIIQQVKEGRPQSFQVSLPVDVIDYIGLNLELPLILYTLSLERNQEQAFLF